MRGLVRGDKSEIVRRCAIVEIVKILAERIESGLFQAVVEVAHDDGEALVRVRTIARAEDL